MRAGHVFANTLMGILAHRFMCTHAHTHAHTYTHTHTYVHIRTHTHTYMRKLSIFTFLTIINKTG